MNDSMRPLSPIDSVQNSKGIHPRHISRDKIKAYLKNPDFDYTEKKPDENFFDRFSNWLVSLFSKTLDSKEGVRLIFWIFISLMSLVLAFAIYKIFGMDKMGLFQRGNTGLKDLLHGDSLPEREQDYSLLIRMALDKEDYPEAIRYWYFRTLRLLDEKGWIALKSGKSNQNYINEMRGQSGSELFTTLTRFFDYSFYGGFRVDLWQYREIEKRFTEFLSQSEKA